MHIIIPMSGIGKRFIDAGYTTPKPLIEVDGMPIIEHVVNMFPGEMKFTFICNSKHLKETNMRAILERIKPTGEIVEIPNHKLGPVYAVAQISDRIDDEEEVMVNYCDFGVSWDYQDFLNHTRERKADGALVGYKGFHPHLLNKTAYAYMKERDADQWMVDIKEKESFTDNRMNEYASNGTHYFRKGSFVKKYFQETMDQGIHYNNEYYVSLVFKLLLADELKISIYGIEHMLQWGTPEDTEEYLQWSAYFRHVITTSPGDITYPNAVSLIPMAGHGSRFSKVGYKTPKPLIEVSGVPMIIQASRALPVCGRTVFIAQEEHLEQYPIADKLKSAFSNTEIYTVNEVTEGQACTCDIGLDNIEDEAMLFIGASDNGMVYDHKKLDDLIEEEDTDAIIFTVCNHVSSMNNPEMYGWVHTEGNIATGVSVKKAISENPADEHAFIGCFYFKKNKYFREGYTQLIEKNVRVNNEFYVDSLMGELVDLGYTVKVFEVDNYLCWGTPNDYETFVYWQSYFHKAAHHPYSLELDPSVDRGKIIELDAQYRGFKQENR
jgi:NDP-sugar pyrophosphorylase family protein